MKEALKNGADQLMQAALEAARASSASPRLALMAPSGSQDANDEA